MLSRMIKAKWPIPVLVGVVVLVVAGWAIYAARSNSDSLVIYNARAHYGDEQVFHDFEEATGIEVTLRGGSGPELYERLKQEGEDTPADVLITTDLANLWRAKDAGLLQPATSPTLQGNVPAALHDGDDDWWALSTRLRIPVVSTERVAAGAVTSLESLGHPQFKGRTCIRTSNNEYNQSLVADLIAKRGHDATKALLSSWMANEPTIVNSDVEVLSLIADGGCDVGLSNHYYLGRALAEDAALPVAPAWPYQDGAGAHANVSGAGVVVGTDKYDEAVKLLEFLTSPPAQEEIVAGSEFAANPAVLPPDHIADWASVKVDPIAVNEAGPLLGEAVALMLEVGWS
jgi:iron(III) transport system substrate-binding protein